MRWPEKLEILCKICATRCCYSGPESLNEVEMALCRIPAFQAEMINGGFWAFFYNSTGTYTVETIDALNRIGANSSASLLSQAVPVYFGNQPVPPDTHARAPPDPRSHRRR